MKSMQEAEKEKLAGQIREKIETVKEDIVSYTELTQPVAPDDAIGRLTRMDAIGNNDGKNNNQHLIVIMSNKNICE